MSEYGITPVSDAVHINRALREAGLIAVRAEEFGREILDAGACAAFALADHQIAHVYVNDRSRIGAVRALLERLDGVERVLDEDGKRAAGLDHPRSGELVAISKAGTLVQLLLLAGRRPRARLRAHRRHSSQARLRPGRTVRRPGDPLADAGDRAGASPSASSACARLLDVISLKATDAVKGSHGRLTDDAAHGPLVISSRADLLPPGAVEATGFKQLVLEHLFS